MLQVAAGMWSTCSVVAWCAAATLLASTATAARLDLWPTSTGPLNQDGHSRTYAEGMERIGCGLGHHCHAVDRRLIVEVINACPLHCRIVVLDWTECKTNARAIKRNSPTS